MSSECDSHTRTPPGRRSSVPTCTSLLTWLKERKTLGALAVLENRETYTTGSFDRTFSPLPLLSNWYYSLCCCLLFPRMFPITRFTLRLGLDLAQPLFLIPTPRNPNTLTLATPRATCEPQSLSRSGMGGRGAQHPLTARHDAPLFVQSAATLENPSFGAAIALRKRGGGGAAKATSVEIHTVSSPFPEFHPSECSSCAVETRLAKRPDRAFSSPGRPLRKRGARHTQVHTPRSGRGRDPSSPYCAASTMGLAESTLFGHVRGAFPRGLERQPARFPSMAHIAERCFLDENR